MAIYAVSDIHGCYTQFQHLLDKISLTDSDELYILGDVVDRGPKSPEVLQWCLDAPANVHVLLGNHEDMAACVISRDPDRMRVPRYDSWTCNGGAQTRDALLRRTDADWRRERLVPWLRGLAPYALVEAGGKPFALVHAGLDPRAWDPGAPFYCDRLVDPCAHREDVDLGHGLGVQNEQTMVWAREGWFDHPRPAPVDVVFGHTPTTYLDQRLFVHAAPMVAEESADFKPGSVWHCLNRHDIDCGCAYGGRLAALRLDDMQEFYVRGKR